MRNNGTWRSLDGEVTGSKNHSVIVKKLVDAIPELSRECDNLKSKDRIKTCFSTKIGKRSDFKNRLVEFKPGEENKINIFTDGSRTEDGAGAGYILIGKNIIHGNSHSVSIENSVYQTEILAIKDATEYLLQQNVEGMNIIIHLDNQAAIRSLSKYNIGSKLVSDTKREVNKLAAKNKVHITWVPGHSGIRGNEIADRKARLGSMNLNNTQPTKLPVNKAFYRQAIRGWGRSLHQKRWDRRTSCRQTGMLLPNINGNLWKIIKEKNRKCARLITQVVTGHNNLQRHLSLMFQEEQPDCKKCGLEPETTEHLIRFCPGYKDKRREAKGKK